MNISVYTDRYIKYGSTRREGRVLRFCNNRTLPITKFRLPQSGNEPTDQSSNRFNKKVLKMKLTEDFLVRELRDDEMLVVNGGLSSPLTGGEWCGVGCNGSDGNACGIGCGGTTTPEIPDVPVTPDIPITNRTNL